MGRLIVNIDVPNLKAGIDFYVDGLGFVLQRTLFNGVAAELQKDDDQVFLIEQPAGSQAVPGRDIVRSYEPHWTPIHLDVIVEDLDDALKTALAAGAKQSSTVSDNTWGRLAPLRDPFGHGICLLQFQGDGYDAVEG